MSADNKLPMTRVAASKTRSDSIRTTVRTVQTLPTVHASTRLAAPEDAEKFFEFLSDPAVSAPIYTLPRPLSVETVGRFIQLHEAERNRGNGLLFISFDENGQISGYSDFCVWPQWAAGELGGAIHPERQGQGRGTQGAVMSFGWMFNVLNLDLICETAAPDNVRTARLLDGLGFSRMGEVISQRSDGTQRASLVWEMTRSDWQSSQSAN